MKIIFLDIDGVMNCRDFMQRFDDIEKARKENCQGGFEFGSVFTPDAVETLNYILNKTNAKLVISSSWRIGRTIEELQRLMDINNIECDVIDRTPYLGEKRGLEIQDWLDKNRHLDIESFVIIDDDRDMEHLMPYLVKTTWKQGLREGHIEKAVNILNRKIISK